MSTAKAKTKPLKAFRVTRCAALDDLEEAASGIGFDPRKFRSRLEWAAQSRLRRNLSSRFPQPKAPRMTMPAARAAEVE